nr:HpaII family restriction endonuclease [Taylorella equigenitalis]
MNDILEKLSELNPLNLLNLRTYEYKFKNFLRSLALGMKPTVPWDVKEKLMEVF